MQPPTSNPFPPEQQAAHGFRAKSRTHRGRRSKGKGPKPTDHHAQAKEHMAAAQQAATPQAAHGHLFRAISALNKAKKVQPDAVQMPV